MTQLDDPCCCKPMTYVHGLPRSAREIGAAGRCARRRRSHNCAPQSRRPRRCGATESARLHAPRHPPIGCAAGASGPRGEPPAGSWANRGRPTGSAGSGPGRGPAGATRGHVTQHQHAHAAAHSLRMWQERVCSCRYCKLHSQHFAAAKANRDCISRRDSSENLMDLA